MSEERKVKREEKMQKTASAVFFFVEFNPFFVFGGNSITLTFGRVFGIMIY